MGKLDQEPMRTSSTSIRNSDRGGITFGAPRSPYARWLGNRTLRVPRIDDSSQDDLLETLEHHDRLFESADPLEPQRDDRARSAGSVRHSRSWRSDEPNYAASRRFHTG